jgi:hypothetical protein
MVASSQNNHPNKGSYYHPYFTVGVIKAEAGLSCLPGSPVPLGLDGMHISVMELLFKPSEKILQLVFNYIHHFEAEE